MFDFDQTSYVNYSLWSFLIDSDLVQFYTKFESIKKDRREYYEREGVYPNIICH
jgi:hypothetical protein